ncbi:FUSC family protein [Streptomyces brevispora]|uniref:FUSC family protein n=1 Tax=Streptomyces brevispora TaxID=887462 RepID=UPI0037184392
MAVFWITLGIVVLGVGLVDLFLTSLNYDEAGFLATPLCALQWRVMRRATRRMPRRWRPVALRQAIGLQIAVSLLTWLVCVVLGFGFIYYGLTPGNGFSYDGQGLGAGMFSALYLSAAQLATVGTSQITPETDALRMLTILETLSGLILVTVALTFLLGVYQVVRDLSAVSSKLFNVADAEDEAANLAPYFPQGQVTGLDSYLQSLHESFASYTDGLRLHHVVYYFQSGRDHFSLPYALDRLGGIIAALRWGLPADHPAAQQPILTPLTLHFTRFAEYLHQQLRWQSTDVPEVVAFDVFAATYPHGKPTDRWVSRFLRVDRAMAELAALDGAEDAHRAYQRYQQWLPFTFRAQQTAAAVGYDLDYQPFLPARREEPSPPIGRAGPALRIRHRPRTATYLRLAVPDPGLTRLAGGTRTLLAVVTAIASLYGLFAGIGLGANALPVAMFGGMVAMQAATMARDATVDGRRLTTGLMILPAVAGVAIGAATDPVPAAAAVALVGVVFCGVWVRRFGNRYSALGQLGFMTCYFALLLGLSLSLMPWLAVSATVGTIWAYLARFALIPERPARVLDHGLVAFSIRLLDVFDPLIDAVSAARWDPDITRQVRTSLRRLHKCGRFLEGQLRVAETVDAAQQPGALRLRLFDIELAAGHLAQQTSRIAQTGTMVPIVIRARMAGMLTEAQHHLHKTAHHQRVTPPASGARTPDAAATPAPARPSLPTDSDRRLHDAVEGLLATVTRARDLQTTVLADRTATREEVTTDSAPADPEPPPPTAVRHPRLSFTTRQAIQAAVATGLALLAGTAVSPTRQYWAAIAAFVVFGGTDTSGHAIVKGLQRIAGTLLGAIVGFSIALLTGATPAVVLPLIAVCVFAAMYTSPISYTQMVFWMTMLIALLYEFLGTLNTQAIELRVIETILGAAIGLATATFLLPTRTREKLTSDLLALLDNIGDIIQTALTEKPDQHALRRQTDTMDRNLRRLYQTAAPLRRAAGALHRDGIERQLTVASALAYYTRHLTKPRTSPPTAAPLDKLAELTDANLHALTQAITGQPPVDTHDPTAILPPTDDPTTADPAVRSTVRINEIIIALTADITPGDPEADPDRE